MFEFGRELRRLFGVEAALGAPRDGMTGGDATLLELLDLKMLLAEAKSADVAAGRIGEKDKARRLLESAVVWREVARRSGDAAALRKAAATAEAAHLAFDRNRRGEGASRARVEQALCAMLGAELYGDDGLNAAAEKILRAARRGSGAAAGLAGAALASLQGRQALGQGDLVEVRSAARSFNEPIAALESAGRRDSAIRVAAAEARLARAELLEGAGMRLKDEALVRAAIGDLEAASAKLDPAYEPLTWARIDVARAAGMVALGELSGDIGMIADAVSAMAQAMDGQPRDHSPLDWAKGQAALATALQSLGESGVCEAAFEKAVTSFDRAAAVLKDTPALSLRATVASNRAICLARSAELSGDLAVLDAAEAAFKTELAGGAPKRDPIAWALIQTHLGRLYEARVEITGKDRGERAAAALAFSAALDVFGEQGLRSLSDLAAQGLERLKSRSVV